MYFTNIYIIFVASSVPKSTTCTRLSEILPISHVSRNRFLERENYTAFYLFQVVKSKIVSKYKVWKFLILV